MDKGLSESESKEQEETNVVLRAIMNHYKHTTYVRSDKQLEREKWLIPGLIPFNRWILLPAAVAVQFCVGSLYAWSVFNKPIDNWIYGQNRNLAPIAFYIACGLLGSSAAVMGPWLERRGPLIACILGTSCFCTGHFVTALALHLKQMWLVYIGYGLIGGFGTGLSYISPVSALQKWFPDRRGLASGFAVCGFGAGSIAIAKVQLPLIDAVGLPLTFVVLGGCYLVVMMCGALVLRSPPPDFVVNGMKSDGTLLVENKKENNCQVMVEGDLPARESNNNKEVMTLTEALVSKDFRLLYLMMVSNVLFGICAMSRLSNLITDIFARSPDEAATIVSVNGGFNLGGRLAFSIISDYLGRKSSFQIMITTQLLIVACYSLITNAKAYWAFVITMWVLTSCYGGGFGTIPAFLTDRFGPSNTGACHGVILTAWSLSGVVGGLVYTAVFDAIIATGYTAHNTYPYNVNSWWILCIIVAGWIASLFVSPTEKDRQFRTRLRAIFRCRRGSSGTSYNVSK